MGITVTKQRYKIKPLLCVTDKNPNNITWNVLVFFTWLSRHFRRGNNSCVRRCSRMICVILHIYVAERMRQMIQSLHIITKLSPHLMMHQENYRFRLVLYTPAIGVAISTEC